MTTGPGRNDPCPCGSGKKYKQCCLRRQSEVFAAEPDLDSRKHAVARAMNWLLDRHAKAFEAALGELLADLVGDAVPDHGGLDLDKDTWTGIQINLTEWLLAEGTLAVRGAPQRTAELLLGRTGPALSAPQREWLAQLAQRPLRLYAVTQVVRGQQLTLCDALNLDAAPQQVMERVGSMSLGRLRAGPRQHRIAYQDVPVGTIKKRVAGKGSAGKHAMTIAILGRCGVRPGPASRHRPQPFPGPETVPGSRLPGKCGND